MNKLENIENILHNLASPKRSHTFWGMLAVVALMFGGIWLKHGEWLAHPNDQYLSAWGDGFKNYATTAWHVRNDSTFVHYEGMNYPYGEHALFTDNQPIFASFMQWWNRHVWDIREQTVAWINVFEVVSMLLGAAVMFLLFRKLHLPIWYAGVVTLGMMFLTPQWLRVNGHFGLSHTFVNPSLLYLLCLYEERQSKRYQSLLIGALVWFAAQLHFYFFGLAALFLSLYTAYQLLRDFSWKNFRARVPHWVVMVLLPFALLNLWLHWADFAPDRPGNPYGFSDAYIGFWEGIFLPYPYFPEYQWIDKHIVKIRRIGGEAEAYAGVVAALFFLWVLLGARIARVVQDLARKEKVGTAFKRLLPRFRLFPAHWENLAHHRVHQHFLRGIFMSAFFLTLFACGFPFNIHGLEWMVDYMGPLKQFRGLARFTWCIFYVVNLIGFYYIWHYAHRLGRPWARLAFCLVPALLLVWEAYFFQKNHTFATAENTQIKAIWAKDPAHWLHKVDFSKYQALLPLPYYHMGSENIWLEPDLGLFTATQLTAFQTHTPDMGVNMSRTAIGQMVKSVQLTLTPGEIPAILDDLPDARPLAVMVTPGLWEESAKRYPYILGKAKTIYENKDIHILELPLDSIRVAVYGRKIEVEREIVQNNLFPLGKWRSSKENPHFYQQSFDSLVNCAKVFQGKGAFSGNMGDSTWLYRAPLPRGEHLLSLWIRVNQDLGMLHDVKFFEMGRTDGKQGHWQHEGLRFHLKSIVGDWGLFEVKLNMEDANSEAHVFLHKKNFVGQFYLDEVMIRPAGTEIYRKYAGWIVRNNYWMKE